MLAVQNLCVASINGLRGLAVRCRLKKGFDPCKSLCEPPGHVVMIPAVERTELKKVSGA